MTVKKTVVTVLVLTVFLLVGGVNLFSEAAVTGTKDTEPARIRAVGKAKEFARFKAILAVKQPQVNYSHTRFYEILGRTEKGRMLIAVDPERNLVVRMVKLCPYPGLFTEQMTLHKDKVETICRNFLKENGLPDIPKGYKIKVSRERNILKKKQYKVVFRHFENEIPVHTDFVSFLLSGTGEVVSYSMVHHDVKVSTTPRISKKRAIELAKKILGTGKLKSCPSKMKVLKASLKIVYPNHYFKKWKWEWSDKQALVWIVQFGRKGNPNIDVWIDAHTGKVQGGEIYERPIPELIGIPDQTGDIIGIWQPAMDKMQYNTGTGHTITGYATEAAVINAIQDGFVFVLQTHGLTTDTAEYARLNYFGAFDEGTLEPDEVPDNNLFYALVSCCHSGHDGPGADFKDTFIHKGALCFQGYEPSINPDPYETSLVKYLARGASLYDADLLAQAETGPWFDIIIKWQGEGCFNIIYLAPLRVNISAPSSAFCSFTISATVSNGEAAQATTADDVYALLELPAGFTITAGDILQNTPSIPYGNSWTATWTVSAPTFTFGSHTFDVIVWSDNLGVAVHDFNNPYHKFSVNVFCPGIAVTFPLDIIIEPFRWWDWARTLYPDDPIPEKILKFRDSLVKDYRSEYYFKKNPMGYIKAMLKITELEKDFGLNLMTKTDINKEAIENYISAVDRMNNFLLKVSKMKIEDVFAFFRKVGKLQKTINEKATIAFVPKVNARKSKSLIKKK